MTNDEGMTKINSRTYSESKSEKVGSRMFLGVIRASSLDSEEEYL